MQRRLVPVHGVELDEQGFVAAGLFEQQFDPAPRQDLRLGAFRRRAGSDQCVEGGRQRRPLGRDRFGQPVAPGIEPAEFVVAEILAARDHAFERHEPVVDGGFLAGLQLPLQGQQVRAQRRGSCDLALELRHLLRNDFRQPAARVVAQQSMDFRQRQIEPPQRLDAVEPRDVLAVVEAVAAARSFGRHQQADIVIVTQCAHGQPGAPGEFADLQKHAFPLQVEGIVDRAATRGSSANSKKNGVPFHTPRGVRNAAISPARPTPASPRPKRSAGSAPACGTPPR